MRTTKLSPNKTYFIRIKSIFGLAALFYLSEQEYNDDLLTGLYQETFYGITRRSYHVLFSLIDYDYLDVWALIKEHDKDNNRPY